MSAFETYSRSLDSKEIEKITSYLFVRGGKRFGGS